MDFAKKLQVGTLAEAQDYPEDRLRDVLAAVKSKISHVSQLNDEIDCENTNLEQQIEEALQYQAQLIDQGCEIQTSIANTKQQVSAMSDEKLELNRQIRIANQEATFFQGQAELLKNSLQRDIQLLQDRERKQKVISQRE